MIISRLMGGLGNQMFQYAVGRALALRTGATLKLDVSHFDLHRDRQYALGCFRIEAELADDDDLAACGLAGKPWPGRLDGVRRRLRAQLVTGPFQICQERSFRFDPAIINLQGFTYLQGYWQSEKYFLDQAEMLRHDFEPAEPTDADNARLAAGIDAVNAVSIHVRRGDYVRVATTNRYHGTCSIDYYRAAVEYVSAHTTAARFFVFSDEPEWVSDHFKPGVPTTIVSTNSPDRGYRDMLLMARCRHHIIANSSFSWWGAWLGRHPGKIVVAPTRWFNVDLDTRDLVPDTWVRM
jgi:hypothetical protein